MSSSKASAQNDGLEPLLHPAALPPSVAEPVFILGSVRSGTSVMVNALRQGAGIPGCNEGNIAALMQRMLDQVEEFFRKLSDEYLADGRAHLIANVDRESLETHVVNYFVALYARHMGPGRWVDKSPDSYLFAPMIRSCPLLVQLFPKAKFIFCARRGIENVMSRMKKFPHIPFGYQCRSWSHTFEEWYKVKPGLGERGLEVYQRDMAIRPAEVVERLARFLDLGDGQRDGVLGVLSGRRYEQTQSAREHEEISIEDTPWDEGQRVGFIRWCQPMMKAAGFTLDGQTFASEAPIRLFYPTVEGAVKTRDVNPEFGFTEVDARTLQLHPNDPGQPPATVCYPGVALDGRTRFVADLSLDHDESQPVRFALRIERPGEAEPAVATHKDVERAGTPVNWEVSLPQLSGDWDVIITTEMAGGATSSSFAWARWRNARLC